MTLRTVSIALASYRRADGVSGLFGLHGEQVDVHPDDLERFDRLNAVELPQADLAEELEEPDRGVVDLQTLNLAELRDLADEQGVDLGGATRKADIIAALSA